MLVHYGSDKFDPGRLCKISNYDFLNKPIGALWLCHEETDDWAKWSITEDFAVERLNKKFRCNIKSSARILKVSSIEDVLAMKRYLRKEIKYHADNYMFDWVEIAKDYDAFELVYSYVLKPWFGSWDVSSVVVFNKDVIEEDVIV